MATRRLPAPMAAIVSMEKDCIGVDAGTSWQVQPAVINAADKALKTYWDQMVKAGEIKLPGFSNASTMIREPAKQGITSMDVVCARITLDSHLPRASQSLLQLPPPTMHCFDPVRDPRGASLHTGGGQGTGTGTAVSTRQVDAAVTAVLANMGVR